MSFGRARRFQEGRDDSLRLEFKSLLDILGGFTCSSEGSNFRFYFMYSSRLGY